MDIILFMTNKPEMAFYYDNKISEYLRHNLTPSTDDGLNLDFYYDPHIWYMIIDGRAWIPVNTGQSSRFISTEVIVLLCKAKKAVSAYL